MLRPVLLLLLLFIAACARPPEPVWTELPTAAHLLQQVSETTGQVDSLDAAASVGLTINGKYRSVQQFLLVQKPNRLRVDVLTGFGQLVMQLASDGEELSAFLQTTVPGRFYRGAASDDNLTRFTRIPLSGNKIVRLLLYDPPLISYQQHEVEVVDEQLVLRLRGEGQQQELRFDRELRLVGCRYFTAQELFLEVQFLQIDTSDQFPRRIQIALPTKQLELKFKFTELQTDLSIAAERFRLTQPKNLAVEPLP